MISQSVDPGRIDLLFFFGVTGLLVVLPQFLKRPDLTAIHISSLVFLAVEEAGDSGRSGCRPRFYVEMEGTDCLCSGTPQYIWKGRGSLSPHPSFPWRRFWGAGRVKYHFIDSLSDIYFLLLFFVSVPLPQTRKLSSKSLNETHYSLESIV